jgi:hypothetical protein
MIIQKVMPYLTFTLRVSRYTVYRRPSSPHFSPGSRAQAQDSCLQAPLWSEKRSNSYGLSEEQACGHEDQPEP